MYKAGHILADPPTATHASRRRALPRHRARRCAASTTTAPPTCFRGGRRKPVKLAYMWRDVERRATRHGIPFNGIPDYPNDPEELATRVALLASKEGWCPDFVKAAYACWFLENKDPGDANNLSPLLARLGKKPDEVIAKANSEEIRKEYRMTTEAACALGIFGSPTFVCGQEIFWGDDRLEDAIDWCLEH